MLRIVDNYVTKYQLTLPLLFLDLLIWIVINFFILVGDDLFGVNVNNLISKCV